MAIAQTAAMFSNILKATSKVDRLQADGKRWIHVFENLQASIKKRILIVLLVVHAGLILGIFALARESFPQGWDLTSNLFLASTICLYGGFVMAVLFVVLPVLPWLRRAQKVETWTDRLVRDLPFLLENLPKIVGVFQSVVRVWNEARNGQASSVPREAPSSDETSS